MPCSFERALWGFNNLKSVASEQDAEFNLESGDPIIAPRSLFSIGFVKKKVLLFQITSVYPGDHGTEIGSPQNTSNVCT